MVLLFMDVCFSMHLKSLGDDVLMAEVSGNVVEFPLRRHEFIVRAVHDPSLRTSGAISCSPPSTLIFFILGLALSLATCAPSCAHDDYSCLAPTSPAASASDSISLVQYTYCINFKKLLVKLMG